MSDHHWQDLPTTTSALENQHYIYYLQFDKKLDLVSGLRCLQALAEKIEAEDGAETVGQKTRYSRLERPSKRPRPNFENDGRAPDTADSFKTVKKGNLPPPQARRATAQVRPKSLA
ncbi:hypothetical protein OC834_007470 [Tilletia horrida]|nr:hypothetical protein OC834_007470 [Tilletia horrida]KAK0551789.1 hypothetical protein OC844_006524 [Tilletia horrida]